LWRGVVGCRCVGEGAGGETCGLHLDGEVFIRGDVLGWFGRDDDGGDHVGCGGNFTHDWNCRIVSLGF